jgi:phosphoribosyl 1,2-cyclic phosphate phosphodiesterase
MTTKTHQITILGSGTSTGIPVLGCVCSVCQSLDPKDQRLRTSVLLKTTHQQTILVDTSPDLRTQLLTHRISHLDGVILTHDHADHLHGIDDLRPFTFPPRPKLDLFTNASTHQRLRQSFPYLFDQTAGLLGGGKPRLNVQEVILGQQKILNENFHFFENAHGPGVSLSFIHDKLGYLIDCHEVTPETIEKWCEHQLDLLLIDCVQREVHQTHLWLERSLEYIELIQPKKAGLIHMGHKLGHTQLSAELKLRGLDHVFVTYDNLQLKYGASV